MADTQSNTSRLVTTATAGSSNQPAVTLSYTYNKNGNRFTRTDESTTQSYHFDTLTCLTQVGAGVTTQPPVTNLLVR